MSRDFRHILDDFLETIDRLELVTHGKTLAEFQNDRQLRFIVQRGIEIISECAASPRCTTTRPGSIDAPAATA
jgi:uncharacterized protein with HEPN domain